MSTHTYKKKSILVDKQIYGIINNLQFLGIFVWKL